VGVLCEILQRSKLIDRLDEFIWSIPPHCGDEYRRSESVLKAQALISYHRANFKELYAILQSNAFAVESHAQLQQLWLNAHYAEVCTRGNFD
jgi:hypothetical protein